MNKNIKLSPIMVEHLNYKLKDEGSYLQYVLDRDDFATTTYSLVTIDKYIDNEYGQHISTTEEFDRMVREFFMRYGVEDIGYTNTVHSLRAWKDFEL